MQRLLLVVLGVAGAFVWLTSIDLPLVVASHFGPGGGANGHMGKGLYTLFMLGLVIVLPALVAFSTLLVRILPPELVNLPNKRYWLAPERRDTSLEALSSLFSRYAALLTVFLCFVHWLVVQANSAQPPKLNETWLLIGLAVFGVATVLWLVSLFRRFGHAP